jgi:transposase
MRPLVDEFEDQRKSAPVLLAHPAAMVSPSAQSWRKAAVDDPARFKSSLNVGAHFGLTPRHCAAAQKKPSQQTATRSVTRVNDQAIKDRKMELDPNARLEKQSLLVGREGGNFAPCKSFSLLLSFPEAAVHLADRLRLSLES